VGGSGDRGGFAVGRGARARTIVAMSRRVMLQLVLPTTVGVCVMAVWAGSFYLCARVTRSDGRHDACAMVGHGKIIFWPSGGGQAEPPFAGRSLKSGEWAVQLGRVPDRPERWMLYSSYSMPLWAVALTMIIGPICYLNHWLVAREALRRGLCAGCGYDLRATPDGGGLLVERCPECGIATRGGSRGGATMSS
jgi:hypothetical protein